MPLSDTEKYANSHSCVAQYDTVSAGMDGCGGGPVGVADGVAPSDCDAVAVGNADRDMLGVDRGVGDTDRVSLGVGNDVGDTDAPGDSVGVDDAVLDGVPVVVAAGEPVPVCVDAVLGAGVAVIVPSGVTKPVGAGVDD